MGWLQRKELKLAVALRGLSRAWKLHHSQDLLGGPGPGVTVWEIEPSWGQVMSEALEGAPPGSGGQVVGRLKERAELWALWAPELVRRLGRSWGTGAGAATAGHPFVLSEGAWLGPRAAWWGVVGSLCGSH